MSRIDKTIEAESKLLIARGWREVKAGPTADKYGVSFRGDGNVCSETVQFQ